MIWAHNPLTSQFGQNSPCYGESPEVKSVTEDNTTALQQLKVLVLSSFNDPKQKLFLLSVEVLCALK